MDTQEEEGGGGRRMDAEVDGGDGPERCERHGEETSVTLRDRDRRHKDTHKARIINLFSL